MASFRSGFSVHENRGAFQRREPFHPILTGKLGKGKWNIDPKSVLSLTLAVQQLQPVMVTCFGEQWDGCLDELYVQYKSSRISTLAPAFLTEMTEKALRWMFSNLRSTHYLPLVGEPASLLLQQDVMILFKSRLALGFVATSDSYKEWWAISGHKHVKGLTSAAPHGKAKRAKRSMSESTSLYDSESS